MADKDFDYVTEDQRAGPKKPIDLKDDDLAAATGAASPKLLESVANGTVHEAALDVRFRFWRPTHA